MRCRPLAHSQPNRKGFTQETELAVLAGKMTNWLPSSGLSNLQLPDHRHLDGIQQESEQSSADREAANVA
jgi:hypothetical protein